MDCKVGNIYCGRLYANSTAEGNDCTVGYVEIPEILRFIGIRLG